MAVLVLHGGEGARAEGDGADARAVREVLYQRARPRSVQYGGGEGAREIRAGERGPARLFQDHGQVEELASPAPVLLGQMDGEQALFREPVPVPGAHTGGTGGVRVEEFTYLLRRYGARQPPPCGLRQLPLFFGDSDAHADPRRSQPLERRKSRTRSNPMEGQRRG